LCDAAIRLRARKFQAVRWIALVSARAHSRFRKSMIAMEKSTLCETISNAGNHPSMTFVHSRGSGRR